MNLNLPSCYLFSICLVLFFCLLISSSFGLFLMILFPSYYGLLASPHCFIYLVASLGFIIYIYLTTMVSLFEGERLTAQLPIIQSSHHPALGLEQRMLRLPPGLDISGLFADGGAQGTVRNLHGKEGEMGSGARLGTAVIYQAVQKHFSIFIPVSYSGAYQLYTCPRGR